VVGNEADFLAVLLAGDAQAEAAGFLKPETIATDATRSFVAFAPLGVVLAVMPWNFPFWQVLRFACAALAAGNAALLKHSPDVTGCALAIEELARVDQSFAITVAAHTSLGTMPIALFGSDEQRRTWLPALASGERLAAFGLTEPGAGSDAGATRTTARLEGGDWVIDGSKALRAAIDAVFGAKHPVLWICPLAMIALCALGGIVPALKAYRTPVAETLAPLS